MGILPDWMIENEVKIAPISPMQRREGKIRCRVPCVSITLDSITPFEPHVTVKDDGMILDSDGTPVFSGTHGLNPDQPPVPCPQEYRGGEKVWTGADGDQWKFNPRTGKWVNVAGPVERGRGT